MTTNHSATPDEVLDSPTDWVAAHIRSYVETNGENGHLYMGSPTLLLTTRGRKSGKLRRTPLIYGRDGDRYLLVASNGGCTEHPAWYLNVVAHPESRFRWVPRCSPRGPEPPPPRRGWRCGRS